MRKSVSLNRGGPARPIYSGLCRKRDSLPLAVAAFAWLSITGIALAQHGHQVTVATPFHQTGNSFFEQIGVGFNFHAGNFFFQQNVPGAALPPFGGAVPGAGLQTGFNVHAPGGIDAQFHLVAAQGAGTNMVSTTPSVTLPNGMPGGVFDASMTPFVMGVVPVVGDQAGGGNSPLRERLERLKEAGPAAYGPREKKPATAEPRPAEAPQPDAQPSSGGGAGPGTDSAGSSSAGRPPAASVSQLRQAHAAVEAAEQQEVQRLVEKGRQAEAAGKPAQACILYRQAAHRAASPLKEQLLSRAAKLAATPTATPASAKSSSRP